MEAALSRIKESVDAADRRAGAPARALGLASAGVSAWAAYKLLNAGTAGTKTGPDIDCHNYPGGAADMSRLAPGAPPIRCRRRDTG